mgnify:CR=1 FL=1
MIRSWLRGWLKAPKPEDFKVLDELPEELLPPRPQYKPNKTPRQTRAKVG